MDVVELYRKLSEVLDKSPIPPTQNDLAVYEKELDGVWSQVRMIDKQTWEVETPWHAAILCIDLMAWAASGIPLDEKRAEVKDLSELGGSPAFHFAFRGEGNCTKTLCPSYYRDYNKTNRPELQKAMNNFGAMLKYASDRCFANAKGPQHFRMELFMGAAQHYLFDTPLMDWTTDPRVAVGFAANYGPKKESSVVYVLPLFQAVKHNATFYLPPPFVERLYLQRGFFIETHNDDENKALQESCFRILFREDKEYKVIRNGAEITNLMLPHPALDGLAAHAKGLGQKGVQLIDSRSVRTVAEVEKILQAEWDKIGGIPEFLQPKNGEAHGENWWKSLMDMIERLTHLRTSDGLKANEFILEAVVRSNIMIVSAFQKWLEEQEKWCREVAKDEAAARGWGDLGAMLKRLLEKCET